MKRDDPKYFEINTDELNKLDNIIKEDYSNINGIVMIKNGYKIYEKYYNDYTKEDTHHIASVTKSILSSLIGIAIDKKYIKDTDQKIIDFFPEYKIKNREQKNKITIKHLLTMTAPYNYEDWKEPIDKISMQDDWVDYILNMLGKNEEIGKFKYSTGGAHILSAILTKTTGKNAREFANENLFSKIGINTIPDNKIQNFDFDELFGKKLKGWAKDPKGNSTGGWGLKLTAENMAKFGYLYINKGVWDSQQIISKHWIEESTKNNSNNYGYMWWLGQENNNPIYLAIGDGGNMICCIPYKDLVISIASEFMINPKDRWTLIKNYILNIIN
jgi:CubicO group peptidase (beta-lactamase class C family)